MSEKNDFKKQIYGNPNWINGRINRAEYLFRTIGLSICFIFCISSALAFFIAGLTFPAAELTIPVSLIPAIFLGILGLWGYWLIMMICVKRLHDLGWSGWLAVLVPFSGLASVFIENHVIIRVLNVLFSVLVPFPGLASIFIENNVIIRVLNVLSLVLGLFLLFRKGNDGANKYGKDPLMKYEENQ